MGKVYDLIITRRSVRKFLQLPIKDDLLKKFVNAARLAPSASNIQPCEYLIVNDKEKVKNVFTGLKWAGYINPEGNPEKGEEPVAYIIVLIDLKKKKKSGEVDAAAGIQNILLSAWEEGVGSCWIKSVKIRHIKKIFRIPHNLRLDSVIALGYPSEEPVIENADNSIKYWKDKNGILHVPKRKLEDIVHFNIYGKFNKSV
ncbi:nitroreductase family protein [bacterium]|nr:nitroreductase family protein [bacterium]